MVSRFHSSKLYNGTTVLIITCLLTGCTVTAKPVKMNAFVDGKRTAATAGQEPVTGPVDVYEAIARALKYNLDLRVETAQQEIKLRDYARMTTKLLPNLATNASYDNRSNDPGGVSRSLTTGSIGSDASASQGRDNQIADLSFSWNILDFGLSWIRAGQAADEVLIAREAQRKATSRLVDEVLSTYWRAVSYQRIASELQRMTPRLDSAIRRSRHLASDDQTSPVDALTSERDLLDAKRQLLSLTGEIKAAKVQLAALMNIDPATDFSLATGTDGLKLSDPGKTDELIDRALKTRPEMVEIALNAQINRKEADAALLELLPGIQLYADQNYDGNVLLYNQNWVSWGAKAGWNLMKMVQYPSYSLSIKAKDRLIHEKSLALTMAIMTQVYVSHIRYVHAHSEFVAAAEYLDVQQRLVRKMRAQVDADKISEQVLIREEVNTVMARIKRDIAYAEVQNAIANLYTTLGREPCASGFIAQNGVEAIASQLQDNKGWQGPADSGSGAQMAEKQPMRGKS